MHSGSFMYQIIALTGVFGTVSVCLAFALLLPGVGQALAAIWTLVTLDWFYQRRQDEKSGKAS